MRPPRHRTRRRVGAAVVAVSVCGVAALVGVSTGALSESSGSVPPGAAHALQSASATAGASPTAAATARADTAPADTAPADTAAAGTAPADTAPAGTAAADTVPGHAPPVTSTLPTPSSSVSEVAATATAGSGVGPAALPQQPVAPTATDFAGSSTVGALFSGSVAGGHRCSASVVDSPGGDLIVTAAHCVSGSGAGLLFVPGYDRGATPHGVWTVIAAYADPAWLSFQDPDHDYAFLRVADSEMSGEPVTLESEVGGETLGLSPGEGDVVTVSGYAAGSDDDPISCTAAVTLTGADPTFSCEGFVDGTSGSPWLSAGAGGVPTTVVGLIGGRRQGGCESDVSYSAPFDSDAVTLWQRASADGPSDILPMPGASGCGSG